MQHDAAGPGGVERHVLGGEVQRDEQPFGRCLAAVGQYPGSRGEQRRALRVAPVVVEAEVVGVVGVAQPELLPGTERPSPAA